MYALFLSLLPWHVQEFQLIWFIFPIPISCTDLQEKVNGLPVWNQHMTSLYWDGIINSIESKGWSYNRTQKKKKILSALLKY